MNKSYPLLASKKKCTGCMACVDACFSSAIKSFIDKDGHLYVNWIPEKCTHCGKCSKICPAINKYDYQRSCGVSRPYAGWANNDVLRMQSASGGIFAALASFTLREGGFVEGAVMDGCKVKHIVTNDPADLPRLQGSKYQQGELSGIYRRVLEILKNGETVLFSGTGCQVGALYSFLNGKKYKGQLITVDLICGGFPSVLPLQALQHSRVNSIKEVVSFRDKSQGWKSLGYRYSLKIIDKKNIYSDLGDKNLVLKCFSSLFLNRSSCLNCRFAFSNRQSDITIADFWGEKEYPSEHFKGVSLVVTHSPIGEEYMKKVDVTLKPTIWENFINRNARMIVGRLKFYNLHPGRVLAPWLFRHMSYAILCKIYGASDIRGIVGLPFMISSFLIRKVSGVFFNRQLKNKTF